MNGMLYIVVVWESNIQFYPGSAWFMNRPWGVIIIASAIGLLLQPHWGYEMPSFALLFADALDRAVDQWYNPDWPCHGHLEDFQGWCWERLPSARAKLPVAVDNSIFFLSTPLFPSCSAWNRTFSKGPYCHWSLCVSKLPHTFTFFAPHASCPVILCFSWGECPTAISIFLQKRFYTFVSKLHFRFEIEQNSW